MEHPIITKPVLLMRLSDKPLLHTLAKLPIDVRTWILALGSMGIEDEQIERMANKVHSALRKGASVRDALFACELTAEERYMTDEEFASRMEADHNAHMQRESRQRIRQSRQQHKLTCQQCGDTFTSPRQHAKYCSHACRMAASRQNTVFVTD